MITTNALYAVKVLDRDAKFTRTCVLCRVEFSGRFCRVRLTSPRIGISQWIDCPPFQPPTIADQEVIIAQWLCEVAGIHEIQIDQVGPTESDDHFDPSLN